ncbi:S1C family serine protease [Akkermansiaceae bacterium]|nr:S1C family serine protease [Akkermansiaceae bacterium]
MKLSSLRAVLVTAFSLSSALPALAQVLVTFPREGEAGAAKAVVFPADDAGTYVTVGIVGADVTSAKSGDQTFELLAQDTQSRVTLLKSATAGTPLKMGSSSSLKAGSALYKNVNKVGGICRVVSWEGSFHEQHLPLDFLRVHYSGQLPDPGQPLYNEAGELVAIAHQPSSDFGNGTYALPIEAVLRNVVDYKAHQSLRRCWLGLHLDQVDPIPRVVGLRPESPAAEVGLKKGDVLLGIANREITSYSSAINAFYYLIPGKKVELSFLRGTQVLTAQINPKAHPGYEAIEVEKAKLEKK